MSYLSAPPRRRSVHSAASRICALGAAIAVTASALVTAPLAALASPEGADANTAPVVNYWNGINPITELTSDSFAEPPINDRPWVRWNWPPATTTIEQLEGELDELAAAGIGGVEVGQGGNPTNEQFAAILTKANSLGITVSVKYTGGAPTTWDATNDYTRKTLTNSKTTVDAGASFAGTLPGTGTIVAVLAYRCSNATCETTGKKTLERSSVIDVTSQVTGKNTDGYFDGSTTGSLNWTAPASPAGAQWQLVTFRSVQYQSAPETLSKQGTDAMIAGYEALWTPEIKELLRENGGDIFVDSHTTDPWGTATELWGSNIASDFQSRAGYSILPDLAALFYSDFAYSNGRDERVRTDFYQVRNDLFIENRVNPFTAWANTLGITLRLQPEDPTIGGADVPFQDQIDMSYNLQRSEHESLVGDQIDVWRPITSGKDWTGNQWFSKECCAVLGQNYVETIQDVQARMNKAYAAGITKVVYHVYPTESTPTSTFPGYANFGPTSFAGSWGPRNPNWASDGYQTNTWLARNEQVLTQGRGDVDVAVYLHSFEWQSGATVNTDGSEWNQRYWEDEGLQRAGYTWNYVNPTLLNTSEATVTDHVLHADGPSYKALVLNTGILTPNHPHKTAMSVATAKRVLELAEDGLPIVLVGEPFSEVPGDKGSDAKLQAVFADLLAQPGVSRVSSEAGVPAKLAEIGVQPDAKPAKRSTLFSRHVKDDSTATDYYFLFNQGKDIKTWESGLVYEEPEACRYSGTAVSPCRQSGSALSTSVTLTGTGTPYLLDADAGTITPISEYSTGEGTVTVDVALGRDESTIVALSSTPGRFGVEAPVNHVVSTTADSAAIVGDKVVLQSTRPGTYTAQLADGTVVSGTVDSAPATIDLTGATWSLDAEDWKNANPLGTTGAAGSAFAKDQVAVTLDGLAAWPDIPELASASGVGRYSTQFDLESWNPRSKAELSLGQVVDTFTVTVNGAPVPMNIQSAKADIGPYLKSGRNTLEVRVSTTLNNRLSNLFPAVATRGVIQEYGIVGPVTLTGFGSVEVSAKPKPVASTTTAKLGKSSIRYYDGSSLTVRVTGSKSAATGTVSVLDGSTTVGSAKLAANGRATVTLSKAKLKPGTHTLTVRYGGDASYTESKTKVSLKVAKATSSVKASLVKSSVRASQRAKIKTTVTSKAPLSGTVSVTVDGKVVKASASLSRGKATVQLPKLDKGTHKVKVSYKGRSTIEKSHSRTLTLRVK